MIKIIRLGVDIIKTRIHWNYQKKKFTNHNYKGCSHPDTILIEGAWATEVKPKKTNPRGFVICDSSQVHNDPDEELINTYKRVERLEYDKKLMIFSRECGEGLICDSTGCWLIERRN